MSEIFKPEDLQAGDRYQDRSTAGHWRTVVFRHPRGVLVEWTRHDPDPSFLAFAYQFKPEEHHDITFVERPDEDGNMVQIFPEPAPAWTPKDVVLHQGWGLCEVVRIEGDGRPVVRPLFTVKSPTLTTYDEYLTPYAAPMDRLREIIDDMFTRKTPAGVRANLQDALDKAFIILERPEGGK